MHFAGHIAGFGSWSRLRSARITQWIRSTRICDRVGFGLLKRRNRDFSSDSWKVVKELFQRVPTFGVVNERMNRDARAGEDGGATQIIRV